MNNNTNYNANVETFIAKYLLGAPLSPEEIKAIASLSLEEQKEKTIQITTNVLQNLMDADLDTLTVIAFQTLEKDTKRSYNLDPAIKQTTFLINSRKIAIERQKQKGNSR